MPGRHPIYTTGWMDWTGLTEVQQSGYEPGKGMSERIVGFCRFSFWGRSDWGVYAGTRPGSGAEARARERSLASLYDDARLEFRFRSFESLTLPSLAAQENRDFTFVVLSSTAMPAPWRSRLATICAPFRWIRLVFSDRHDVGLALAPVLDELSSGETVRLVQFRLDDDDCVCIDYIDRLARAAHAMRDYRAFAFSLPRALMLARYAGSVPHRYEYLRPFHAAGAALRAPQGGRSIFAFGHFALARRFPSLTDPDPYGSVQLKCEGHDSRQIVADPNEGVVPMPGPEMDKCLKKNFPFLKPDTLLELASGGIPRQERDS